MLRERDPVWTRWEDVDRLFAELLDLPEAKRRDALERRCAGDAELRQAVLELLELSRTEDPRASAPGAALLRAACGRDGNDPDDALPPGEVVGRYRLVSVLGRGGMATVYEAQRSDGAFRRTVALKVLRRGLDTDRIVARFLNERQILSDFAHPNIARLLDGGATADGRPYLVMEMVTGRPLTAWADERGIGVRARLRLFLQVVDAVQEAHRRLVVHRDLKPSNIMVDREGRVKLLDFGIAKLLNPESEDFDLTRAEAYPLTRRYASPEQERGERVTTSSDIYQLGLILCELLAGAHPFEESGHSKERPPPPSLMLGTASRERRAEVARRRGVSTEALARQLRGDLDTIVLEALERDPLERYRSADDLGRDIRLHLDGRPIHARPAPRMLRIRKWLGRNRWAAPVAALLAVIAAGYVATVTLHAQRLEQERNEARAQAERAERIKSLLIDLFRGADPFEGGDPAASADLTVAEALTGAAERIRTELHSDPIMQADLLGAVASILENLDRTAEGRILIEEALELRRRAGQANTPGFAADLEILAQVVDYHAPDTAVALLETAAATLEASVPPNDPRLGEVLASLFWLRAAHFSETDPAIGERALAIYEANGPDHDGRSAGILTTLAEVYMEAGRAEDAEMAAREALGRQRSASGPDHPATAIAAVKLAGVLDDLKRYEEAIPLYREGLRILLSTAGPTHNQTLATRNNLATTLQLAGHRDEAIEMHREILATHRQRAGGQPSREVATSLQNLAAALKAGGRLGEADSLAARAHEIYLETTPEGHYLRGIPLLTRAEILLAWQDGRRAEEAASAALSYLEPALPEDHYAVGVARCRLGAALMLQARVRDAAEPLREGLATLRADARTPAPYLEECEDAARALRDEDSRGD